MAALSAGGAKFRNLDQAIAAKLADAYAALFGWLEAGGGKRGDGPIVEVYLNDPHDTAPADLVTEIRLPLV